MKREGAPSCWAMRVEPGPGPSGAGRRPAEADGRGAAGGRSGGSVMATARTTYEDGRGAEGAAPAGHTFVWVSLRDPSPEELASVQHEFALPGPLIDDPDTSANRPALEVSDQLVFAEVNTISWVAAEEAVRLERVQLVLGDGFVVSVDRNEPAVERVSQDLRADAELAGAGPAAVLTCVLDHAVERYGPVLSALNDAVDEAPQQRRPMTASERSPRTDGTLANQRTPSAATATRFGEGATDVHTRPDHHGIGRDTA